MKQVTRDVDPASVHDLLERAGRACLAYTGEDGPQLQPVALEWLAGRYLVGLPDEAEQQPTQGQEAVLLVDDGVYYFDLRAIYVRGQAQPVDAPAGAPQGRTWFELHPIKTVAWDYGALREVSRAG